MSTKPTPPKDDGKPASRETRGEPDSEPGTNEVEHEPDPKAQPLPDGHHKFIPKSPFTAGNS